MAAWATLAFSSWAPARNKMRAVAAKELLLQLNVEMMGLNRERVCESSFNQTVLRFADSRESGGSSDHFHRCPVSLSSQAEVRLSFTTSRHTPIQHPVHS